MVSRTAAVEATRERMLDAATELFMDRYYDDVSIALVAQNAGVSAQTLLNHFGDKERLFAAVVERVAAQLDERRGHAVPEDAAEAIRILVDDYEITGDATIRLLAVEERLPVVRAVVERGRRGHREWIERVFAVPNRTSELLVLTDIYVWKLLRRDQGLSVKATASTMHRMVDAVLTRPPHKPTKTRESR